MGDELGREEGRGTRAGAVHPGSCSLSRRPRGRGSGRGRGRHVGGGEGRERTAGRPGELAAAAGLRAGAKAFGAYLGPAQPLLPLGRSVPRRGSGFLKGESQ